MAADAKRPGPAIQAPQAIRDCHALLLVFCILKKHGGQ